MLTAVAKDKMDQEFRKLAVDLMQGKQHEDIEWLRGFFAGMKHLLNNPTGEARKFEKALNERGEV